MLLPAKLLMGQDQSFQSDGKADVTACHHVLDLEVQESGWEAQLLHHASILPGRQSRLLLTEHNGGFQIKMDATEVWNGRWLALTGRAD